jgi:UPF0755 protein
MFKKFIFIFATISFIVFTLLGIWIVSCNNFLKETRITAEFEIKKNEKFKSAYEKIFGNLSAPPLFYQYSIYVMHLDKEIKYGNYKFHNISIEKAIENILKGKSYNIKITFPEGFTIYDIAEKADKLKNVSKEKILELSQDKEFVKHLLNKEYTSLEGFLFPDTYMLPPESNEKTLLELMVKNFYKNLPANFENILKHNGFNFYQGVILASIIQKETYKDEEYPIVASVFYNRLKKHMKLQSDPTVIYGIDNFTGNIKKIHLKDKNNPYNTYVFNGLPPTPICNPSKKALDAVVNPAKTNFLYFVSDNQGNHIFSKTYKEHKKNVSTYQKNRKRK